jgi:hypothetical protein
MVSITRSNWPGWGHTGPSVSDTTLYTKASCGILPALCDRIEAKKGQLTAKDFLALFLHHEEGLKEKKLDCSKSQTRRAMVASL